MSPFILGQIVQWVSQGSGTSALKEGTIVAIVPEGVYPHTVAQQFGDFYNTKPLRGFGLPRKGETYLVAVRNGKGKAKLYWPRVAKLAIVETQETEAA